MIIVNRLSDLLAGDELESRVLLKLDVQGFEFEVLKGCKELLHLVNTIIVECSFIELYKGQALAYEIVRYLDGSGFLFQNIYNLEFDHNGRAVQGDFVFIKNDLDSESHK